MAYTAGKGSAPRFRKNGLQNPIYTHTNPMKKSVIAIVALSSLALAGCGSSEKKEAKQERVESVAKAAPMQAARQIAPS